MVKLKGIRPSPIAGSWYPAQPPRLAQTVDTFLNIPDEKIALERPLRGVLAPHAGIRFSGGVAGTAFRYIVDLDVDLVVIVAPSHYPYAAPLLSSAHSHYETPFGQVKVAHDLVDALDKNKEIDLLRVAQDPEHAIEIELPFLQRILGEFELLPLAMLDQSWETSSQLGQLLAELTAGRKVFFVASSDLSHFYTQQEAHQLDQVVLDAVANYQPQAVVQANHEGRGLSCGHGAIAAVMTAVQQHGAQEATITGYATSGDVTNDMARVVGYGAALFH